MNSILLFFLAVGLTAALPSTTKLHPLSDEYIAEINSKQSTWRAGRNFEIEDYDLFKILASGVIKSDSRLKEIPDLYAEDDHIPESFDAREEWPECASIIGMIRDQSKCGACWAFAAAEAMSDRICIHSEGKKKLHVSTQDLLTCGNAGTCGGGTIDGAWRDWGSGIVTGGLYNRTDQGCKSYFLPNCEDHLNKCTHYVATPACVEHCDDTTLNYNKQKTYGKNPYEIISETQIQLEIMKNGPVAAAITIYADFASYKSGIYQVTTDDYVGGHAVKILGWGVEDGVKYWLIANSWNERWGEKGFFRILRGRDEASIESETWAALPDFDKF